MQFQVSIEQLDSFAPEFWRYVNNFRILAFHGPMGAGKTTLITSLCRYKGVREAMSSPTFSIINQYTVNNNGSAQSIYHIDLYRLETIHEIIQTGVEECLESGNVCMVEWAEKAPHLFEDNAVHIFIQTSSETKRQIDIRLPFLADAI
jgi:tRNA threonylcarbamoyladenosine biosynthesis protein TsaE